MLAIIAALGGGTLGYGATSQVRGEPTRTTVDGDGAVTLRWRHQPNVGVGRHGPVLELDSLEPGRMEQLLIRASVGDESVRLDLNGDIIPVSGPTGRLHIRVWATADGATLQKWDNSDQSYASDPIAEAFEATSGNDSSVELTADRHPAVETAGPWYPEGRSYCYDISWGFPNTSIDSTIPNGTRLALTFTSTARSGDENQSKSDTSTSNCSTNDNSRSTPAEASAHDFHDERT
jgi:hypothetical protein